jgi:hypothetical protein
MVEGLLDPNNTTSKINGLFNQYRYDIYVFASIEQKLLLSGEVGCWMLG